MNRAESNRAIMLMALGGLESLGDIEIFLKRIMKTRPPTEAQIAEIKKRYESIGGHSPLNEITKGQAELLQRRFDQNNIPLRVFVGLRFSPPYIADTISKITNLGIKNIIALNIAPQRSEMMLRYYNEEIDNNLVNLADPPHITILSGYHRNKHYLKGMADSIEDSLTKIGRDNTIVIFTAHSVPIRAEDRTTEYEKQLKETMEGIIRYTGDIEHRFGYQSKGFLREEWLEPSVKSVIKDIPEGSAKNILFVPITFVSDNLEILYDIDICYRKMAEDRGFAFHRTESLNYSDGLITALYETAIEGGEI